MANESTTSSNSSCYEDYETTQFKIAAALRAGIGTFSFLSCVGVIFIIVLYKKYKFFTQRLILYLTIAAMIHSFSYTVARVNFYTTRPIEDPYCHFGGLFNHYTAAIELLNIWSISFDLFVNAVLNKQTKKLEVAYFVISYFLPLTWFWIPLWKGAYGTAGPWCGIRVYSEDCQPFPFGKWLPFAIWYIPLYISLILIFLISIAVGVKAVRDTHKWRGIHAYNSGTELRRRQIKEEVKSLIWYPIIYLVLNTFSLTSQIYNAAHPSDSALGIALWYLRVLTSPLRGGFIALVYALDSETRRQLNLHRLRAALAACCRKEPVHEYDVMYQEFGDSMQTSTNAYSIKRLVDSY